MTYDEAVDVMAHAVFAQAAWDGVDDLRWEDYPDLGEHAWEDVIKRADTLVPQGPSQEHIEQATDVLRGSDDPEAASEQ